MKNMKVITLVCVAIAAINCGSSKAGIRMQLDKKGSIGVSFKDRAGSQTGPVIEKYKFLQQLVTKNLTSEFPDQKVQMIDEKDAANFDTHVQVIFWAEPGKDVLDSTKEIVRVRVGLLIYDKSKKSLSGITGENIVFVETGKDVLSTDSVNIVKAAAEAGMKSWVAEVKAAKAE